MTEALDPLRDAQEHGISSIGAIGDALAHLSWTVDSKPVLQAILAARDDLIHGGHDGACNNLRAASHAIKREAYPDAPLRRFFNALRRRRRTTKAPAAGTFQERLFI